ncbi:SMI1/KNR4 family protein [Streptomyces cupreus]|uniref:SMI1/KNR4 family protein n=1 Tax=Streptomyces cupreus TaxID=2759956 RepID=A0A7X1J1G0_9ACTN|nr:SMI1/KNR4 family protein [Streptomyces cupreus]
MTVPAVDDAWDRIAAWLARNAPATAACLDAPAAHVDRAGAERDLGRALPQDLAQWWARADGMSGPRPHVKLLPPFFTPLSIAQARRSRHLWLETGAELGATQWPLDEEGKDAGSPVGEFLRVFMPIARDGSGNELFVDLRSGPMHGCVGHWDHEQGCFYPPRWPSAAAMLAEVADALESGMPALQDFADRARAQGLEAQAYRPVVTGEGAISWEAV